MQLSRGVAHFPGGTLFITDSSGRRFSRKNQSTESSAVCVENFRERQDDLYGTCYVPHDPRVRRYGLSAFLVRPLRELDCSKCRSLQLQLEHYLNLGQFDRMLHDDASGEVVQIQNRSMFSSCVFISFV